MNYLKLAWRNIGRNRRRSVLSIVAIGFASLAIVFLFSLIAGMKGDMADNLMTYYTGEVRVRNAQYNIYEHLQPTHLTVPDVNQVLATLDRMDAVASVVPRITTGGVVFRDQRRIPLLITGVDFERERTYSGIRSQIVAGSFPEDVGAESSTGPRIVPAIVGTGVLDRLELAVGDQFTVLTRTARRGSNAMTFSIAAVASFPVASLNDAGFWAPFSDVQRLMHMDNETGEVLVKLSRNASPQTAVSTISTALAAKVPGLDVEYWQDIDTSYSFIVMAETVYNFVALFFFVLASTVIVNTTMMAIFERRQEIGTLGAMGMLPGQLLRLFFTEAVILAVIGAFVGVLGGIGVTAIVAQTGIDYTEAMRGIDFEVSSIIYPRLNLRSTVLVFFFASAVGAITSIFPTLKIARIQPVEALRDE